MRLWLGASLVCVVVLLGALAIYRPEPPSSLPDDVILAELEGLRLAEPATVQTTSSAWQVLVGPGWNLIALPGDPGHTYYAQDLAEAGSVGITITYVIRWRHGMWDVYKPGFDAAPGWPLEIGQGYFVRVSGGSGSLSIERPETPTPTPDPQFPTATARAALTMTGVAAATQTAMATQTQVAGATQTAIAIQSRTPTVTATVTFTPTPSSTPTLPPTTGSDIASAASSSVIALTSASSSDAGHPKEHAHDSNYSTWWAPVSSDVAPQWSITFTESHDISSVRLSAFLTARSATDVLIVLTDQFGSELASRRLVGMTDDGQMIGVSFESPITGVRSVVIRAFPPFPNSGQANSLGWRIVRVFSTGPSV